MHSPERRDAIQNVSVACIVEGDLNILVRLAFITALYSHQRPARIALTRIAAGIIRAHHGVVEIVAVRVSAARQAHSL